VVAGVSNWGGYGVVAALGRLTGVDLLHTPEIERRLIAACVAAGGCDGITRRREPTVDGLSAEAHAGIVDLLRLASRSGILESSRQGRGTRTRRFTRNTAPRTPSPPRATEGPDAR